MAFVGSILELLFGNAYSCISYCSVILVLVLYISNSIDIYLPLTK